MPPKRKSASLDALPLDARAFLSFVYAHIPILEGSDTFYCTKKPGDVFGKRIECLVVSDCIPLPPGAETATEAFEAAGPKYEFRCRRPIRVLDLRPSSYDPLRSDLFLDTPKPASEADVVGFYSGFGTLNGLLPEPYHVLRELFTGTSGLAFFMYDRREHLREHFAGFVTTEHSGSSYYSLFELFDVSALEQVGAGDEHWQAYEYAPGDDWDELSAALTGADLRARWRPVEGRTTSAVPPSPALLAAVKERALAIFREEGDEDN